MFDRLKDLKKADVSYQIQTVDKLEAVRE